MDFLKDFTPDLVVASPGRINIIGEHTDYNLGYVLPTAIASKITFSFKKNRSKSKCHVYSADYKKGFQIQLDRLKRSAVEWENYVLGVLNEISKRTDKLAGFDCVFESDLPSGSGLSSSAALECGLAYGLNELFGLGLTKEDIVKLSQKAEHTYVGTQCGIMDQFASVMSEQDHVILLDCRSLAHRYIPFEIAPYKLILLNTNVSHNLATSEYNLRKQECEEGVALMKRKFPDIESLRDVTKEMLDSCKVEMRDIVYRRCAFIIEENARVLAVTSALEQNDLVKVGAILYEAHDGISRGYEISCPESDFLVDFAKTNDAVLGARQTGGGFGGCTLNLVHEDAVETFVKEASEAYRKKFGIALSPLEVAPSSGTMVVAR